MVRGCWDLRVSQVQEETVDVAQLLPQEPVSEHIDQQHCPVPLNQRHIVGVASVFPRVRGQQRTVEKTGDVLIPQPVDEFVEMVQTMPLERIPNRVEAQIVDILVVQIQERTVEVVKVIPEERVRTRIVELTPGVPVSQIQEVIVGVTQLTLQRPISERIDEQLFPVRQIRKKLLNS